MSNKNYAMWLSTKKSTTATKDLWKAIGKFEKPTRILAMQGDSVAEAIRSNIDATLAGEVINYNPGLAKIRLKVKPSDKAFVVQLFVSSRPRGYTVFPLTSSEPTTGGKRKPVGINIFKGAPSYMYGDRSFIMESHWDHGRLTPMERMTNGSIHSAGMKHAFRARTSVDAMRSAIGDQFESYCMLIMVDALGYYQSGKRLDASHRTRLGSTGKSFREGARTNVLINWSNVRRAVDARRGGLPTA